SCQFGSVRSTPVSSRLPFCSSLGAWKLQRAELPPQTEHSMGTQNISSLNLSAKAKTAAEALLAKHPAVVFTSGRRDLAGQASAMAGNVVKTRDYIVKTYAASEAS